MMQSDDVFCDMINSIQFLNMSKTSNDEVNFGDSGFNSGAEMNADNIFFYEDSCPSLASCINMSVNNNDDNDDCDGNFASNGTCDQRLPSPNYENVSSAGAVSRQHQNEKELKQIKVNVGIDDDLKMILEMDPSLMDETLAKAVESSSHVVECPKITGLPPKM